MDVDLAFSLRHRRHDHTERTGELLRAVAAGTFEIALVLDTTVRWAMRTNGGQSKLTSMKNAANTFIDTMFDSAALGPRTKMSVVALRPFCECRTGYSTATWMDTTAEFLVALEKPHVRSQQRGGLQPLRPVLCVERAEVVMGLGRVRGIPCHIRTM